MSELRGATDIGDFLVSARSFDEYRAMFALTDADLRGRVLDCPGGGASFTAAARARGTEAIAVDPVYATSPRELTARLDAELTRGSAWTTANADRYVWDHHGDPAAHARLRAESAAVFARDLAGRPGHHVAAALPHLPFADGAFDLVLSSHLLFTYADRLDARFHVAALREMARVGTEVRVYPLVDQAGRPRPDLLASVVAELGAPGVQARVQDVPYEFQRGARSMLCLRPAATRTGVRGAGAPGAGGRMRT
ncbi:class I SAM-dependent methyltransferase [Geodermatophilus sp. URMC 61]|uniref:class I SAM-dependent methyltransferase n=1 Tax=Geodermatophilus sp. URMC 61 TaxID=3423411 RepID=UPI00406D26DF